VYTIGGAICKGWAFRWLINVSIINILNYGSLLLMVIYEPTIKFWNTI
jgi:hypothetical protein